MPHLENWKEFGAVGSNQEFNDPIQLYDLIYGRYREEKVAMPEYVNSIGQGRQYPDPEDAEKTEHGIFIANVPRAGNAGDTLPNSPQAPDPSPFVIGPGSGGR